MDVLEKIGKTDAKSATLKRIKEANDDVRAYGYACIEFFEDVPEGVALVRCYGYMTEVLRQTAPNGPLNGIEQFSAEEDAAACVERLKGARHDL